MLASSASHRSDNGFRQAYRDRFGSIYKSTLTHHNGVTTHLPQTLRQHSKLTDISPNMSTTANSNPVCKIKCQLAKQDERSMNQVASELAAEISQDLQDSHNLYYDRLRDRWTGTELLVSPRAVQDMFSWVAVPAVGATQNASHQYHFGKHLHPPDFSHITTLKLRETLPLLVTRSGMPATIGVEIDSSNILRPEAMFIPHKQSGYVSEYRDDEQSDLPVSQGLELRIGTETDPLSIGTVTIDLPHLG